MLHARIAVYFVAFVALISGGLVLASDKPLPECVAWYATVAPHTSAAEARAKIAEGEFTVTRGMNSYETTFGPQFAQDLAGMGPHGRWLNGGGGKAYAEATYLRSPQSGEVVSVVLERPNGLTSAELPQSPLFRYLEGRMIEEIPNQELGKFNVISDYYGPLAYTRDFTGVLQKYLDLLADSGSIYFCLEREGLNTQHVVVGNESISLRQWIETIPGIKVEPQRVLGEDGFRITKLAPGPVTIPRLELRHYSYSMPPARIFETMAASSTRSAGVSPAAVEMAKRASHGGWLKHFAYAVPASLKDKYYQLRLSADPPERWRGQAFEQLVDLLDKSGPEQVTPAMLELRTKAELTEEEFRALLHR